MPVETLPRIEERAAQSELPGEPDWLVIVFDNDYNTFDEVIRILQTATGCSLEEAQMETWEVHHLGKSIVHHATEAECRRVAAIIRTIRIKVEVRSL